jgi:septum formation inhibitor MinC
VNHVHGVLPRIELRGGQLAEVQDLTLHNAVAADAETFADGVIDVGFAIPSRTQDRLL